MIGVITAEIIHALIITFLLGAAVAFLYTLIPETLAVAYGLLLDKKDLLSNRKWIKKIAPFELKNLKKHPGKRTMLILDTSLILITALAFPAISYILLDGIIRLEMYIVFSLGYLVSYKASSLIWDNLYPYIAFVPCFAVCIVLRIMIRISNVVKKVAKYIVKFPHRRAFSTKTDKL